MTLKYLNRMAWLVGLVLLQALVLDHVQIMGVVTPYIYFYLILKLDTSISRSELMIWGFALGALLDVLSDTPGLNAAATTLLAFLRPWLLNLFVVGKKVERGVIPSLETLGGGSFFRYVLTMSAIQIASILMLEFFTFQHALMILAKLLSCTLLSTFLMCVTDRFFSNK